MRRAKKKHFHNPEKKFVPRNFMAPFQMKNRNGQTVAAKKLSG